MSLTAAGALPYAAVVVISRLICRSGDPDTTGQAALIYHGRKSAAFAKTPLLAVLGLLSRRGSKRLRCSSTITSLLVAFLPRFGVMVSRLKARGAALTLHIPKFPGLGFRRSGLRRRNAARRVCSAAPPPLNAAVAAVLYVFVFKVKAASDGSTS